MSADNASPEPQLVMTVHTTQCMGPDTLHNHACWSVRRCALSPSTPCHARQAGRAKHGPSQLSVQLQELCRPCLHTSTTNTALVVRQLFPVRFESVRWHCCHCCWKRCQEQSAPQILAETVPLPLLCNLIWRLTDKRQHSPPLLTSLCTMQALLSITAMQAASCCSTWCNLESSCGVTTCTHSTMQITTGLAPAQLMLPHAH